MTASSTASLPAARGAGAPIIVVDAADAGARALGQSLAAHGLRIAAASTPVQLDRLLYIHPTALLLGAAARRPPASDAAPAATPAADAGRAVGIAMAEAVVDALEAKDPSLRGHARRVADLGAAVARAMDLDADAVAAIHTAGRLHDVGEIGIREGVLRKPGPLTAEEYAHIQTHVERGVDLLAQVPGLGTVVDHVHHHHEQFDGGGYPQGLRGEEISLGGRVLAAAEVFDALTSRRPYRAPLTAEDATAALAGQAGRALDPDVYAALRHVVRGA